MTWQDILDKLNKLTPKQLQENAIAFNAGDGWHYAIEGFSPFDDEKSISKENPLSISVDIETK